MAPLYHHVQLCGRCRGILKPRLGCQLFRQPSPQLVCLHRQPVGRLAVTVGAQHVSFSAALTLAHAGVTVAGLVTEYPCHQSLAAFRVATALRYRAPLLTTSPGNSLG